MKSLLTFTLCLLQAAMLLAQQKFTIHGKVNTVTKSKNIHIGSFTTPIKSDGTFELSGELPSADMVAVRTDSSFLYMIWLEQGDYVINGTEHRTPQSKLASFSVSIASSPAEAKIFDDAEKKSYAGFAPDKSQGAAAQQKIAIRYTDSVFKQYPDLKCAPYILFNVAGYVGDDATKRYLAMLKPEVKNSPMAMQLQNDLNQKQKFKEGVFEDFTMPAVDGKDFKLSSLKNKKIILIDFWSSGCAPCREAHPDLIKLYKKYADKGLEIVSISLDDKTDDWLRAIKQDDINAWVNVSDLKAWKSELIQHYYLNYIPFHILLNGDRKILKVYQGGEVPTDKEILANLK
jgi:thiol-disulfide isomerase/thioredoxin